MDAFDGTAIVIDCDAAFRRTARRLLSARGLHVCEFGSGERFLDVCAEDMPGCVVLEFDLPGLSGLEVQAQLREQDRHIPLIFVTARGSIAEVSRAFRSGAVDVLQKPVAEGLLIERIREALALDRRTRARAAATRAASAGIRSLSQREREVAQFVVAGLANKQIARRLSITERTVEFHRSNIMQKLGAASAADMIRIWLLHAGLRIG